MTEETHDSEILNRLVVEGRRGEALQMLTDFPLWMHRLRHEEGRSILDLWCAGWDLLAPTEQELGLEGRMWRDFLRINRYRFHLAKNQPWRVFFQAAVDHADDSVVTKAAEAWHTSGSCDWRWLKWTNRPKAWREDMCVAVLFNGEQPIRNVSVRLDDKIVSWASDDRKWPYTEVPQVTTRIWGKTTGQLLATLDDASMGVGVGPLGVGAVHSWSQHRVQTNDHRVRLWNLTDGTLIRELKGHTAAIKGSCSFPGSRVLTWSADGSIRIWYVGPPSHSPWNSKSDEPIVLWADQAVDKVYRLIDGSLLSLSHGRLHVWNPDTGRAVSLLERKKAEHFRGALPISERGVITWGIFGCLFLWDPLTGRRLAHFSGHTSDIRGSMMLADGRLLSWSRDHTLRVWDITSGDCLEVLVGHTEPVLDVVELSDGRVVSYSRDETPRIWDLASKKKSEMHAARNPSSERPRQPIHAQHSTESKDSEVSEAAEGKLQPPLRATTQSLLPRLHALGNDHTLGNDHQGMLGEINTWDASRASQMQWIERGSKASARTTMARQWPGLVWKKLSGGPRNIPLNGHTGSINGIVALEDDRIVSWSDDGTVRLWEPVKGAPVATVACHDKSVLGIHLCSNHRVLSWSSDGTIRSSSLQDGSSILLDGHVGSVLGAQMMGDERVLSWSLDGTLRIWNIRDAIAEGQTEPPADVMDSWVMGANVLDDGRMVSWFADGTLRVYDMATGTVMLVLKGHTGPVTSVLVLEGNRLLSWSEDHTLRLWDTKTGDRVAVMVGHTGPVRYAELVRGDRVVSWSDDSLRLWDAATGRSVAVLRGQVGEIRRVEVLANQQILSSSGERPERGWRRWRRWRRFGASLTLWDSSSGKCLWKLPHHKYPDFWFERLRDAVLLVPDNRLTEAMFFGRNTVRNPIKLEGSKYLNISGALILKDGRLISWLYDRERSIRIRTRNVPLFSLQVWDLVTGKLIGVLEGHTAPINDVVELNDGRVASSSTDGTIRIWETTPNAPPSVLAENAGAVVDMKNIGGGRMASWSDDHKIQIWDTTSGKSLGILEGHTGRVIDVEGIGDAQIMSRANDGTVRVWDMKTSTCVAVCKTLEDVLHYNPVAAGTMCSFFADELLQKPWGHVQGDTIRPPYSNWWLRHSHHGHASLAWGLSRFGYFAVGDANHRVFFRGRHLRFCNVVDLNAEKR